MGLAKAKGASAALPRTNGLVNVSWRASAEPKASDLSLSEDKLLNPIVEFLDANVIRNHQCDITPNCGTVFAAAAHSATSIAELSSSQLHDWFKVVPVNTLKTIGASGQTTGTGGGAAGAKGDGSTPAKRECLIDDKAANRVGILLQKFKMKHQLADDIVVATLRKAILSCQAPVDLLEALHEIVTMDAEGCAKVTAFVKDRGASALSLCNPEAEHRLIYAVCEIPNVADRLQCLIFEAQWPEMQRKCSEDLKVLEDGMRALTAKRDAAKRFFQTALQMGNALNKDSHAPVSTRGFKLSSLPKLMQLKSTFKQQYTLLHIVLSLMGEAEVKVLIDKLSILATAKDRKSYGVHQRCHELLSGLLDIERRCKSIAKQMCKKTPSAAPSPFDSASALLPVCQQQSQAHSRGFFVAALLGEKDQEAARAGARHRRRSPGPMAMSEVAFPPPPGQVVLPAEEPDPDDVFHERMQQFLEHSRAKARYIATLCKDIFDAYWEVAVFFEDPWAVYPPPSQKETDTSEDLFALLSKLFVDIDATHKEVIRFDLRKELADAQAPAAQAAESSAADGPAGASQQALGNGSVSVPLQGSPRMVRNVRTPSPAPQVARSSTQLDATALRRLREVRPASVTRACSATRGSKESPAVRKKAEDYEDDGEQSDVSDWEASPRQKTNPWKAKACAKPVVASTAVATAKSQPTQNLTAGPPRRNVRRPGSPSPSPAARSAGASTPGSGFRDRFYTNPNVTATAVVSNSQATPTASLVVPSAEVPPWPVTASAAVSAGQVLGPPPARKISVGGRKSLQPSPTAIARGTSTPIAEASPSTCSAAAPQVSPMQASSSVAQVSPFFTDSPSESPPQRPVSQKPSGEMPKRNKNRKSLSMHADRVTAAAYKKLMGSEMVSDSNSEEEATEEQGTLEQEWSQSSSRRKFCCSTSSSSSGSPSPSAATSPGAEHDQSSSRLSTSGKVHMRKKRSSLTAEIQDEFRRRSRRLSRGSTQMSPRRQRSGVAGLTPVAEPGETPEPGSAGIGRGAAAAHNATGSRAPSPISAHPIALLRDT
jgi:hypothetical protein